MYRYAPPFNAPFGLYYQASLPRSMPLFYLAQSKALSGARFNFHVEGKEILSAECPQNANIALLIKRVKPFSWRVDCPKMPMVNNASRMGAIGHAAGGILGIIAATRSSLNLRGSKLYFSSE